MVLLLRKLYLFFTKDPEGSIIFQGRGGCQTFFNVGGGVQMLISFRNPCTYLLFSRGVSGPPIPPWICTWAVSS